MKWRIVPILCGFSLMLVGCDDLGQEPEPPFDAGAPVQTIARTRIVWAEDGRTSAVIYANTVRRYQRRDEVMLEDSVQVDLYDENGRLAAVVTGRQGIINERERTARVDSGIVVRFLGDEEYRASTLTATQAHADDQAKQVIATGEVRITTDDGVSLETDRLIWDGRTRRFRAPGRVRITNGTEVEEGIGLVANADLTKWTMREVTGRSTRPAEEIRERLRREVKR